MTVNGVQLTTTQRLALMREEYEFLGLWSEHRAPESVVSIVAPAQAPQLTPEIREAFTPLDSYPFSKSGPLPAWNTAPVLSVAQAGN